MRILIQFVLIIAAGTVFFACGGNENDNREDDGRDAVRDAIRQSREAPSEEERSNVPSFNRDSAYYFIERQVAFGPRVPNTEEHRKCAEYLYQTLSRFTDQVNKQNASVEAFDGTRLNIFNIEASFYPEYEERILLCAHWDTRPYADFADDPEMREVPIPGANDGGSGVGVLLEIARQLAVHDPGIGVDIVFFDAEDYGVPHFKQHEYRNDNSWALGAQYWSERVNRRTFIPRKGILLDMVGARNARFNKEGYSMQFAPSFTRHVWNTARRLGHDEFFRDNRTIQITDDHYYVNTIAGIPTINIIDHDLSRPRGFGDYWHTHNDNMEIISRRTLNAVGETVLTVIFEEPLSF